MKVKFMKNLLKTIKLGMCSMGILTALIGLILCINPEGAIISIIKVIGWILLIAGGISATSEFLQRNTGYRLYSSMAFGITAFVFGIVLIITPESFVNFVGYIIAAILLIHGINAIVSALNGRKYGYNRWKMACLTGAVYIVFAAVILKNPFSSVSALMLFIGIILLITGISNVAMACSIGKAMHRYNENSMGDRYIDVKYNEVDDK